MSSAQSECFVELSSFSDLARYACSLQEYPKRVYSHELDGSRIVSCTLTLANTLVIFYTPMPKFGRYISYQNTAGKEICDIAKSTKDIASYAPIIHMDSEISPLPANLSNITDRFYPLKVKDLGSLARLTYDHEFPDQQNFILYVLPHNDSWVMGHITSLDMDEVYYNFNYVELDSEPLAHFMKYQGNHGKDPEFSDNFIHGYAYLPIVKVKNEHSLFGFSN